MNKKCIFDHYRAVQIRKSLLIDIIFAVIIFSNDLFRVALYRLMLVLHKDALFHCDIFSAAVFLVVCDPSMNEL